MNLSELNLRPSYLWRLRENATQMQSITKQTLSLPLDLSKLHSRLLYIHTPPSLSYHPYTHRHTQVHIAVVSVLDCELSYPAVIARLRD